MELGDEVGNVGYDPISDRMLVDAQGRGDLAMIDPASLAIERRVPLPGLRSPAHRLYVAAESGTVTVLDLRDRRLSMAGSGHLAEGAQVVGGSLAPQRMVDTSGVQVDRRLLRPRQRHEPSRRRQHGHPHPARRA